MISSAQKLAEWLPKLQAAEWLAVDTEADSLHAYPEKICLLQISLPGGDLLVDPLAKLDLAPLWEILRRRELIMHGADYDLRLLRRDHDVVPQSVFDTMLAARLLGCREFGLTHLVANFLGTTLEKGSQKADWARRPLTTRMETYARNDTHYLQPLAAILRSELEQKGRLTWLRESCARLVEDCTRPPEDDRDSAWRVKGSHLLDRRGLAVLRALWHWRDAEAVAANRPPYFILSHEKLIELAENAAHPHAPPPPLPAHLSPQRRAGLTEALARGQAAPASELPEILRPSGRRPTEAETHRMGQMKLRRDKHAANLGIDPTLIASRATLLELAQDWEKHAVRLMNWQRELLK